MGDDTAYFGFTPEPNGIGEQAFGTSLPNSELEKGSSKLSRYLLLSSPVEKCRSLLTDSSYFQTYNDMDLFMTFINIT